MHEREAMTLLSLSNISPHRNGRDLQKHVRNIIAMNISLKMYHGTEQQTHPNNQATNAPHTRSNRRTLRTDQQTGGAVGLYHYRI